MFLKFIFFLLQVAVIAGNLDLAEVIENHKAGDSGIIYNYWLGQQAPNLKETLFKKLLMEWYIKPLLSKYFFPISRFLCTSE
jgi:hypothetical protein